MSRVVVAVLAAGLGGCGGGSSSSSDAAMIDVTAANRDTVSHAAAVGILALSSSSAIPLAATATAAGRESALALSPAQRTAAWPDRVLALLKAPLQAPAAAAALEQPQAVIGPVVENCALSGTVSVTLDDADNSNTPSVGDAMTIVFNACQDTAGETLNGAVAASYLAIDLAQPSLSARLVLTQLSDNTASHTLMLSGQLRLDYSMPGQTSSIENTTLTVEEPVAVSISTHLQYTDSVTLGKGWKTQESYDASVAPPAGNTEWGRTTLGVNGSLESVAAGGRVAVSTESLVTAYGEDLYPRSGVVRIEGRAGVLRLTALSTAAVQLDLDADDNGSWESSTTVDWDWLL